MSNEPTGASVAWAVVAGAAFPVVVASTVEGLTDARSLPASAPIPPPTSALTTPIAATAPQPGPRRGARDGSFNAGAAGGGGGSTGDSSSRSLMDPIPIVRRRKSAVARCGIFAESPHLEKGISWMV